MAEDMLKVCRWLMGLALLQAGGLMGEAPKDKVAFLSNGVTAHRGGTMNAPENTLAAFQNAMEMGVDWLELDILLTKDGQLVVCHDRTTGRTADQDLAVAESTFEELRALDAAYAFRRARGLTLEECPKMAMPSLREVLLVVMTQAKTRVSIQPKVDCVGEAVALIRELKAVPWVGFNEGALSRVVRVKELEPQIPVFWDRPAKSDWEADLRLAKEHHFEALVYHESAVTEELIRRCRKAGFEVGAWTVNERQAMERLVGWGIDRLYTDDPQAALEIFDRREAR
jgi:glycerophosphoryl diester phosphodiesterase